MLRAALLLPVTEICLRTFGFLRCQKLLEGLARFLTGKKSQIKNDPEKAQRIAELVDIANRHYSFYVVDCVTRSLVIQYFLIRNRLSSDVCVGVRTITGQFESHVWVEHAGVALREPEAVRDIYTGIDYRIGTGSTNNR